MSVSSTLEFSEFPGWREAKKTPLPGDASTRRFLRLVRNSGREPKSAILMIYGEETDVLSLHQFSESASLLGSLGLRVPSIYGLSESRRHILVEDFGDTTLQVCLASGADPLPYYEQCLEILSSLRNAKGPLSSAPRSQLDKALFLRELMHTQNWLGEKLLGLALNESSFVSGFEELSDRLDAVPSDLCHRDFHSRNLMVLEGGTLGIVDFQDSQLGPRTYDVASLAYDAYVTLPKSIVERLRNASENQEHLDLAVAQRMIKAAGTFAYQAVALGRTRYLSYVRKVLNDARGALIRIKDPPNLLALLEAYEEAWPK